MRSGLPRGLPERTVPWMSRPDTNCAATSTKASPPVATARMDPTGTGAAIGDGSADSAPPPRSPATSRSPSDTICCSTDPMAVATRGREDRRTWTVAVTTATSSCSAPRSRGELLAHPVGHRRAILVRDVVTDVVPVRVHDERRLRRFPRDPLRLLGRKEAVLGAVDHEERAGHLVEDAAERERFRLLERLCLVARLRVENVASARQGVQRRPALREIVGTGERDDGAQPLFVRRRAGAVDASHADAHETDAVAIDVLAIAQAVEDGADYRGPFGPDGESRRVLRLARTIDRQGSHAPAEEVVLHGEELFLGGVEAGNHQHQRRAARVARLAQDARDRRPLERDLDALAGRVEMRK